MDYTEHEYKVLDIDVDLVAKAMHQLGAKQVYDDIRTITYFDDSNRSLKAKGEGVKLTEEEKLKLEYTRKANDGQSDTVKLFVSRKQEAEEFLRRIGLVPVTTVRARRISYELGPIDFDIDCFPGIPAFMEVDLTDSEMNIEDMLSKLGLTDKEVITATTPEIFRYYGRDYFTEFSV